MVIHLIPLGSLSTASPRRCVCSSHTAVSMETTVLKKSTEPRSAERSTSFIVLASVNLTEGKEAPTVKGSPSSLWGVPLKVTSVPGLTDSELISIFFVVTHPIPNKAARPKTTQILVFMLSSSLKWPLTSKCSHQCGKSLLVLLREPDSARYLRPTSLLFSQNP